MQVIATFTAEATSNTAKRVFEVRANPDRGLFYVYEWGVSGFLSRSNSLEMATSFVAGLIVEILS